jgi:hypothetical protein
MSTLKLLQALWFRAPGLEAGEAVIWSAPANRQQGWRAVGGLLTLTSGRLIFSANRIDAMFWGRDMSVRREALDQFGVAGRSLAGGPLTGGLRQRLQVSLTDGDEELFVVKSAKRASSRLTELMAMQAH